MAARYLYDSAMQESSFAGPYARAFNTPQKQFLGNEPVAPLSEVIAALAAAEGGGASAKQQKTLRQQIQPQPSPQDKTEMCAQHCAAVSCAPDDRLCTAKQLACKAKCLQV